MTPSDIEAHLRRRFMERAVDVSVTKERMRRGGEALMLRWSRPSRKDRGVIMTAIDSPLDEMVLDIERELIRKERGA